MGMTREERCLRYEVQIEDWFRRLDAGENPDPEEFNKIMGKWHRADPWRDEFHLGCDNYPNCDIAGCGAGDGDVGLRD